MAGRRPIPRRSPTSSATRSRRVARSIGCARSGLTFRPSARSIAGSRHIPALRRNMRAPANCSRIARPTRSSSSPMRPTTRRSRGCGSTAANGAPPRWRRRNTATGSTSIIPVRCSSSATSSSKRGSPNCCARQRARAATACRLDEPNLERTSHGWLRSRGRGHSRCGAVARHRHRRRRVLTCMTRLAPMQGHARSNAGGRCVSISNRSASGKSASWRRCWKKWKAAASAG